MSLFSRIYQKVFVSIDLDAKTCKIKISYQNKNHEEKTYKTINADFPIEAAKYIRKIQDKYPYTYIAAIIRVENQGLITGNKLSVFEQFSLNISSLKIMLVNKQWFIYVDKKSLQEYKNKFSKIDGIDFIFSPFIIIYEKIKDKLDNVKKLYILQEKNSTSLLIADKENIYFGDHIVFENSELIEEAKDESKDEAIIEFDIIDEIDENIIIKDFEKNSFKPSSNELGELSIANHMIELIKNTLNSFYQDSRYASDFIDELLILDGYGISDNAISHLKNNTMLETHFIRIDICQEIENLIKMEVK